VRQRLLIFLALGYSITALASHIPLGFDRLFRDEINELREIINTGTFLDNDSLLEETPSQPQGPFYPLRLPSEIDSDLSIFDNNQAEGIPIYIQGHIMSLDGEAIPHATIEIWQACASGRYNHALDSNNASLDPNFQYYASTTSDSRGIYIFKTIIPGPYPATSRWWRPPHIHFMIQAPGFQKLITQLYFDGDSITETITTINNRDISGEDINIYNNNDLILQRVPSEHRSKLIISFRNINFNNKTTKLGLFNIYLKAESGL
jgi:protocatechuate 3,4-dioxygenase beta subunit